MSNYKLINDNILDGITKLEDQSINCIVTSPPYWGLRDYGDEANTIWDGKKDCKHKWGINQPKGGRIKRKNDIDPMQTRLEKNEFQQKFSNFCIYCGAWKGQLGLESTFNLFIKHLVQIFEAIKPKLRDDGSLWVNLGDTYYDGSQAQRHTTDTKQFNQKISTIEKVQNPVVKDYLNNIRRKSLIGIPQRFMISMIDSGWICRNEIIWHKPSTMPCSAKDRFTNDFEKFFFFTKNEKYYFKQQFTPMAIQSVARLKRGISNNHKNSPSNSKTGFKSQSINKPRKNQNKYYSGHSNIFNSNGSVRASKDNKNQYVRNKRTVWSINLKGFNGPHFAVYPEELIYTPIDASCPTKICTKCNKPLDIESCVCVAPTRRGIVLDPFNGSGTTGIVTLKQGKKYIGIDINPKYIEMSDKRLAIHDKIPLHDFF